MRFGRVPVREAAGGLLAHSLRTSGGAFKKGRLLTEEDVATLEAAGIDSVVIARLQEDELGEDEAATLVAEAVRGGNVSASAAFTGRVNLFAEQPGVVVVDVERLNRLNLVHEAVTVATVAPYALVEPKQMVATIKIIPFATPRAAVEACVAVGREGEPLLRVAALVPKRVGLIQTQLPGLKDKVLDKTVEITRGRVEALCGALAFETRCPHQEAAVAEAIGEARAANCDILLIAGASAVVDRRDVLPAGIEQAGGRIVHYGMPVDPGNLIVMAEIGDTPVIGLPGCARSPKLNGFDWVLQRLAADIPVTSRDIMLMGAGGLLTEIPGRPLPRAKATSEPAPAVPRAPRIAALVLAAGQSRRMGANKMLAEIDGLPMLAGVVDMALRSQARPVLVVTGHQSERARQALGDRPVSIVENADFAQGLSTSLKAGLRALPDDVDGVVVCLGDMPRVTAAHIDRLIAAFNPVEGRAICVPTFGGRQGNPVLWDRRFIPEMLKLSGDVGAKRLIGAHSESVAEVAMSDAGVLLDVDTPQALADLVRADPI